MIYNASKSDPLTNCQQSPEQKLNGWRHATCKQNKTVVFIFLKNTFNLKYVNSIHS